MLLRYVSICTKRIRVRSWLRVARGLFTGTLIASLMNSPSSAVPGFWEAPAIRGVPVHDRASLEELVSAGARLFTTKFNVLDGAGRPDATGDSKPTMRARTHGAMNRVSGPDASSCAGCHNEPRTGGSGEMAANVFVGAHFADPPTTSTDVATTSERNTNTIAGAGFVELLAREMTKELRQKRDEALARAKASKAPVRRTIAAKGISFGALTARPDGTYDASEVEGVDPDLVVKPFGRKGVIISIREFTVAALNQHHGIQAVERFGWEKTGTKDFDGDGVEEEFSIGQVTALTLFQANLPAPGNDPAGLTSKVSTGEKLFNAVGCTQCHVPFLFLDSAEFTEPSPENRPGTARPSEVEMITMSLPVKNAAKAVDGRVAVSLYSDLKRHVICDAEIPHFCNEILRQDNVPQDQFITPRLWDMATSAPYGHRGDLTTISEAVLHHGGEARAARAAFLALTQEQKQSVIAFVGWLGSGDKPVESPISPGREQANEAEEDQIRRRRTNARGGSGIVAADGSRTLERLTRNLW